MYVIYHTFSQQECVLVTHLASRNVCWSDSLRQPHPPTHPPTNFEAGRPAGRSPALTTSRTITLPASTDTTWMSPPSAKRYGRT